MNTTVMNKIFSIFEAEGIGYCHFKSNQHLDESFEGKSDFDVLADEKYKSRINVILSENNAKRFESPKINNYPGIENWLVFDNETGIIYHLHFHYQLLTGKTHVKEYLIPWYKTVLNDSIWDQKMGVRICNPSLEIVLLLTRIVLKSDSKIRRKARFGSYSLKKDQRQEFEYLLERADKEKVLNYTSTYYGEKAAALVETCLDASDLSPACFLKLNKDIKSALKMYRRVSPIKGFNRYMSEKIYSSYSFRMRRKGRFVIGKKVSESGGLAIAFVGTDGSGKSTTSKEIYKWLSKKIECQTLYLGTGDGATDLRVKFLKGLTKFAMKTTKTGKYSDKQDKGVRESGESGEKKAVKKISLLNKPAKYMSSIIFARIAEITVKANKKKLIAMNNFRVNGGVCIMDRYPQLEKADMNDGPKITRFVDKLAGKRIQRMARNELEAMSIVKEIKPDVIFRLNISIDTCMNRKPEHKDRAYFENKINALSQLTFSGANIVEINAEQNYDEELLEIKRHIWNLL